MSNIPRARAILERLLASHELGPRAEREVQKAVALMTREKACRRAPEQPQKIDSEMRQRVKVLARTTNLTMTEIARRVGLRNSGRVSEIMHGKR